MDKTTNIILGMLAAVVIGVWLIKRDGQGDLGDEIGDALVTLTSSDESRLQQLEPETQAQVRALIQALAAGVSQPDGTVAVVNIHVGQTLRTPAQEKTAASTGHSAERVITLPSGRKITESWHLIGRAADLYPINPDTGAPDLKGTRDDLFVIMQQTAVNMGFRQLAYNTDDWSRHYIQTANGPTWDGGHVEWHGGNTSLASAIAAEGSDFGLA